MTEAPLSEKAKRDYDRLHHDKKDYLPGLSSNEKKARLARMSYENFLRELVQLDEQIIKLLSATPQPLFGVSFDAVSLQDAWGLDAPGVRGMNIDPSPGTGMNRDAIPDEEAARCYCHVADG